MRVLSIGTDRRLFEEGSMVRERQSAYASKIGNIDTIVFTRNANVPVKIGTLTVTPTNSISRFFYGFDAWRIARNLPKPDVITTQDPFETGIIALFISYLLKKPLHVQVHTDFTSQEFSRHSPLNWIRQKIAWLVLRRASRIRVLLKRTAQDIRNAGIHVPITVLPIFVDTKRYASLSRTNHARWKLNLLCVGRFEKEKRFELAVDALSQARKKGLDVGLTMVGDGRLRSRYYHYAQRLQVADRLEMVGWHHDLEKYYAEADLVLVPSRYEGYGLVVVEALSAGIPVLATDVGVAREAGAIISKWQDFSEAVVKWIESGPRAAHLPPQPYRDLNEYVEKYCADVAATGTAVV